MMKDYKLQIIDAAFIASGVATQAKGLLYRLRPDSGRDGGGGGDYSFDGLSGLQMPGGIATGERRINKPEDDHGGNGDYWLGRYALTDLVVVVPGEGSLLINDVTMNISLQKEVVKTALVGRSGTIKEYIADGDYQIGMSVGLVAVDGDGAIVDRYPERAVAQLREILERPEAIEVSSAFLDLFNIRKIAVTAFSARQMTYSNRQIIDITALSDDDYIIQSTEY